MTQEPRAYLRERLLLALTEQHDDLALILLDAEGNVVEWFRGAEQIFGYTADEVLGTSLEHLFVAEDRALDLPRQELEIAASSGAAEDDRWQVRKDGSRLWAHGVVTALRDEGGKLVGFAKLLLDRTDVRGQLSLLENRLQELERRESRRAAQLATLAHELRSPLQPIASAFQILAQGTVEKQLQGRAIEIARRQMELIRRLVDDLGRLAELGIGRTTLERQPVDVEQAILTALETCRGTIESRGQHVDLLAPPRRILCPLDPVRVQQIFVNLITNGSKYTPAGGHVWVTLSMEGPEVVVRVRDDGIGIPPDMQTRVFDLFTQVRTSPEMSRGGLGLGLAVVKELVELHGGSVQVRSEGENKGSEFIVRFPFRAD